MESPNALCVAFPWDILSQSSFVRDTLTRTEILAQLRCGFNRTQQLIYLSFGSFKALSKWWRVVTYCHWPPTTGGNYLHQVTTVMPPPPLPALF
jgi:hypothetical protein